MKILVIAEKPSVARDIARVLKCNKKKDGCLYSDTYIVSWAIGHLVTLYNPEDYDIKLKKWRIESLPIIPNEIKIKAINNTKSQFKLLKKLMNDKDVEYIICATDSGREGELIFRYIYELSNCKKVFKRLWISSMTDSAIKEGFKRLKNSNEYDNLYLSAKCRSQADWLVGINASRAFTIKYGTLLSIGRVQTPTLAIIVKRQEEIDSFVSKPYWEVEGDFETYKGVWFEPKSNDTKIFDKQKAEDIKKKTSGKNGIVISVEEEKKTKLPPFLYDLTQLQRDCNKKYSFSAKKTLSVVQELYEKRKLVTYPRTDSRYLSDDMIPKLKNILYKINEVSEYKKFSEYVLNLNKLPISKRIVDNSKVSDHHAIIPTEIRINLGVLSIDEIKVYDLIVRRFIAVFYPNYIYNTTKIVTKTEEELFLSKGTMVIEKGWTELNVKSEKDKKEKEEIILPNLKKGDRVFEKSALVISKKTKPPASYDEAMLLSAMENAGRFVDDESLKEQLKESGLGTPATRAAIIERLLQVGYLERKGKILIPTEKGKNLIKVVPVELKSPETTGKWEKGLSSIAKGKMKQDRFMESITRYVNYIVDMSVKTKTDVIFENEIKFKNFGKCPKCKTGKILENSKSFYCSHWKQGCNFSMWKNSISSYGKEITAQMAKKLIKNGKIENIEITLPQTGEKCEGELFIKEDLSGNLEFRNLKRININK